MDEKGGSEVIFPSKTMKIEKQQKQNLRLFGIQRRLQCKTVKVVPCNWLQLSDPKYGARHACI